MRWNGIFRVGFLCTRERIVRRPGQVSIDANLVPRTFLREKPGGRGCIDATLWAELPFVFLIEEENRRLCLNRLKPLKSPQSSRRCDEGDDNENGENAIGLVSKTTTLHVYHAFSYNSLHDFDMKIPNFTFYWGREQATTNFFFLFLDLRAVPKKTTPPKLAYIWHFWRIGINATKFEKTRIHLKSDVFAAVAVVDLKAP